ncbi:MAG: hypothetical protein A2V52_01155 [Actinobacteria bacterium RBG_19FT_COMBO_54_7]|nr:MAG: hypothetical protein A2W01_06435 [Candidatus Solincola sediminis]OFW68713.1 MAG: hypothetical protein A2V52_01155 [Actinobacteria bacterium RBG_19FT_COMBO_54_7]
MGKEGMRVSNFSEIKDRIERISELGMVLKERLAGFSGAEGEALRRQAREQGKQIGVGAGIAAAGAAIVMAASLYIILVIILLLNIALNRLWLSALIVVLGSILFGSVMAFLGVKKMRSSIKDLPKMGDNIMQEIRQASDEIKKTIEELQNIAKREREERQKQVKEAMQKAKTVAPYFVGAYAGYRIIKRVVAPRKTKRIVLEEWEED